MNLALHGLSGDIRRANSYYEDLHDSVGRFDFVMANPPFNVDKVDKAKLADDRAASRSGCRGPTTATTSGSSSSTPRSPRTGRAGFVMANSASDARASEARDPARADRAEGGRRDDRDQPELLLHRHAAGDALVPRPRQARHRRGRTRCSSSTLATPSGRSTARTASSCPSTSSCSPTSSASTAARSSRRPPAATTLLAELFPDGAYADVPGPLQGRDARRDRGAGLEPQPRPLRRHRRSRGRRRATSR